MTHPQIIEAAKTLTVMCVDFQTGGLSQEAFVNNLNLFSKYCNDVTKGDGECKTVVTLCPGCGEKPGPGLCKDCEVMADNSNFNGGK